MGRSHSLPHRHHHRRRRRGNRRCRTKRPTSLLAEMPETYILITILNNPQCTAQATEILPSDEFLAGEATRSHSLCKGTREHPKKKTMTKHYSTTAFSTSHRSSLLGSELFPTHSLPDTGARRQNWTIQERASRRKTRRRGVIRSRAAVGGNLCRDAPAGFGFCFALSISLRPSPRVRGEYILLSSPLFFFFLFCLLLHLLLCLVRSTAALHRPQGR